MVSGRSGLPPARGRNRNNNFMRTPNSNDYDDGDNSTVLSNTSSMVSGRSGLPPASGHNGNQHFLRSSDTVTVSASTPPFPYSARGAPVEAAGSSSRKPNPVLRINSRYTNGNIGIVSSVEEEDEDDIDDDDDDDEPYDPEEADTIGWERKEKRMATDRADMLGEQEMHLHPRGRTNRVHYQDQQRPPNATSIPQRTTAGILRNSHHHQQQGANNYSSSRGVQEKIARKLNETRRNDANIISR